VVGRPHHQRVIAEGHLYMLDHIFGLIPADPSGEPEALFEEKRRAAEAVFAQVHT
jgi:hypothetical protein